MSPESGRFIERAHIGLRRADTMLTVDLNEEAARTAYLACFTLPRLTSSKSSKSHHGVQTEFFRLTKDNPRVDHVLRRFLSQSYEFKAVADDFLGDEAVTSKQHAVESVVTAKRFVAHVVGLLEEPG